MQVLSALFVEAFDFRQVEGPSTRIDLSGVYFSMVASSLPTTLEPHMVVLIRCDEDESGSDMLEVSFTKDGDEVAKNRQPVMIEPGKFGYQLVRAELDFDRPGTAVAHVSLASSPDDVLSVPLTLMPPIAVG